MSQERNESLIEITLINPKWIKKVVPASYADDGLKRIILFYVINTPCVKLSSSGIPLSKYGWKKNVWQKGELKEWLFSLAGLCKNETFFVSEHADKTKNLFMMANMNGDFYKKRDREKIAIYKGSYNEFESILYHIRNSLAHGRLAMYEINNSSDIMFALEDGVYRKGEFLVRSRMILKKSTLLKWIDVLECKTDEAKRIKSL